MFHHYGDTKSGNVKTSARIKLKLIKSSLNFHATLSHCEKEHFSKLRRLISGVVWLNFIKLDHTLSRAVR